LAIVKAYSNHDALQVPDNNPVTFDLCRPV